MLHVTHDGSVTSEASQRWQYEHVTYARVARESAVKISVGAQPLQLRDGALQVGALPGSLTCKGVGRL